MSVQMNQSLSVDCAVFGFDGRLLKVLLVERRDYDPGTHLDRLKLPGAMILENETLPAAASRVRSRENRSVRRVSEPSFVRGRSSR